VKSQTLVFLNRSKRSSAFPAVKIIAVPVRRDFFGKSAARFAFASFPTLNTPARDRDPFLFCHLSSCSMAATGRANERKIGFGLAQSFEVDFSTVEHLGHLHETDGFFRL
jgi:hypothetical protein